MKNSLILIALALMFLISCRTDRSDKFALAMSSDREWDEVLEEEVPAEEMPAEGPMDLNKVTTKKIIKSGSIDLEVKDVLAEKRKTDTLVQQAGGYYATENLYKGSREITYRLVIRIPADRFESFVASIEGKSDAVTNKMIAARDVTEEYLDLETRLTNKREYLTRYRDLLKKAGSVKDILEIQQSIRYLEEEIESTTGRLRYLSDQVDYSTLTLTLEQKTEYRYKPGHRASASEKFKQSFVGGWYAFVDFLFIVLYNWILLLVVVVIVIWWRRRRRRRRANG